jgi:hypothetical protein
MISTAFRLGANRIKHFLDCRHMIGEPGFHGRGHSHDFVNTAQVVVHEVKRHLIGVVLDLFAESVCQSREPLHPHLIVTFCLSAYDVEM